MSRLQQSGIGWLTPETVHYGLAQSTLAARQEVLNEAYQRHPERFVKQPPVVGGLPEAVWINPPDQAAREQPRDPFLGKKVR